MKNKTKEALRGLLESVKEHETDSTFSAITVDKDELKRLLRWAQNSAYVWFEGDRVVRTGAAVPFGWLKDDHEGTVLEDSGIDGTVVVEWDNAPEEWKRIMMYHNEVKRVK